MHEMSQKGQTHIKNTIKILLQDLLSVFDNFGTLGIKGLKLIPRSTR